MRTVQEHTFFALLLSCELRAPRLLDASELPLTARDPDDGVSSCTLELLLLLLFVLLLLLFKPSKAFTLFDLTSMIVSV